jgi:RimJ/RimL family protein N-acetyltransferase
MNEDSLENIFRLDGKKLSVVPFKSYLLNLMEMYPEDKKNLQQLPNYREYLDYAAENGYAYAILDNGRPVLCFGVSPQWYGVAELWMIPDVNLLKQYRFKFHKGAIKFLKMISEELNLHRIHVTVSTKNPRAIKWIESISFKREGLLKKYTFDKEDMIMYSKLYERQ